MRLYVASPIFIALSATNSLSRLHSTKRYRPAWDTQYYDLATVWHKYSMAEPLLVNRRSRSTMTHLHPFRAPSLLHRKLFHTTLQAKTVFKWVPKRKSTSR